MFDGTRFASEVVSEVRGFVDRSIAPLLARIDDLERRLAEVPAGKDGRDGIDGKDGEPGPQGERGEPGNDGVDGKDGRDGIDGEKGADGKDGRDGADIVDLLIDRAGALVATLSNGQTKTLGPVVGTDGKDGAAGVPGRDGIDGTDGAPGKDGADGVGFDDLDMIEDERGLFLRFQKGDAVREFRLPVVVDRGVFKDGATYARGDGVTWGGSFWICQGEPEGKPDSGKGWRLAIKKGRDGKDGKDAAPPKVKV